MEKVTLRIFDRDMTLTCPPAEVEKLKKAGSHVAQLMNKIQAKNANYSHERIAILTSIQLAIELMNVKAQDGPLAGISYGQIQDKLKQIQSLINQELPNQDK